MDVIEHGTERPNGPVRTIAVTLLAGVALVGLGRWINSGGSHEARTGTRPAAPTLAPVELHFRSDYAETVGNGQFRLRFMLVNDTGRAVTAQPDALPAIPGVDRVGATLLPVDQFGMGEPTNPDTAATPVALARGGATVYALHGHVVCAQHPAGGDVPARLHVDQQAVVLPVPQVQDMSWVAYVWAAVCRKR